MDLVNTCCIFISPCVYTYAHEGGAATYVFKLGVFFYIAIEKGEVLKNKVEDWI